jgi:tetratricopeptide (TPR) repeat protein
MLVLKESYALGQELGDKLGIGYSRYTLGLLARTQGDYAQAVALHEDALPLFREVGDNGGIASVLNSLGLIAQAQGEYSRAAALHRESLSIFKELGDERGIALALYSWARAAFRQGDNDRGMVLCTESLALRRKTEDLLGIAECFEVLALVVTQAQQQRAVRLFATAEALRVAIGAPIPASDRAERDSALANLRRALGDAAFATAWAEGEDLTPEQAVAFASQQSRSNA